MVKVNAPCLSLTASGSLGGSMVFATWKGRPYVRSLVKPANPQSGPQTGLRKMWKFLSQEWDGLTDIEKATWKDRADQTTISNFNAYTSYNQFRFRNFLCPSQEDPAAEVSTPALAPTLSLTAGVRQIEVEITDGATPPDWLYAIFRSTTASLTPAFSNTVAVVPWDNSGVTVYIDTPLDPGTYYYVARGGNDDGVWGADATEASETVT